MLLHELRGHSIACICEQCRAFDAFAVRHMILKAKQNKRQDRQALAK